MPEQIWSKRVSGFGIFTIWRVPNIAFRRGAAEGFFPLVEDSTLRSQLCTEHRWLVRPWKAGHWVVEGVLRLTYRPLGWAIDQGYWGIPDLEPTTLRNVFRFWSFRPSTLRKRRAKFQQEREQWLAYAREEENYRRLTETRITALLERRDAAV